mgnify:CR=1 FL=1
MKKNSWKYQNKYGKDKNLLKESKKDIKSLTEYFVKKHKRAFEELAK